MNTEQGIPPRGWSGSCLRGAREAQALSVQELSKSTKINSRLIQAIEADDFVHLPSASQLKKHIAQIACHLGVQEHEAVKAYCQQRKTLN